MCKRRSEEFDGAFCNPLCRGSGGRDRRKRGIIYSSLCFSPLCRGSGGRGASHRITVDKESAFQSSVSRKWASRRSVEEDYRKRRKFQSSVSRKWGSRPELYQWLVERTGVSVLCVEEVGVATEHPVTHEITLAVSVLCVEEVGVATRTRQQSSTTIHVSVLCVEEVGVATQSVHRKSTLRQVFQSSVSRKWGSRLDDHIISCAKNRVSVLCVEEVGVATILPCTSARRARISFSPLCRGSGGRDAFVECFPLKVDQFQSSVSRKWGSRLCEYNHHGLYNEFQSSVSRKWASRLTGDPLQSF